MKATNNEPNERSHFAFQERVLVRSSSTASSESSSSIETVRLESLAQWNDDEWIHPFWDIDIGLTSHSNNYGNKISRVQMSVSSHGTQQFPAIFGGLDLVPVLPLWQDDFGNVNGTASKIYDRERYLSMPQGFFLSIRPIDGLTIEEEARAVQSVFQELIRTRVLTTPVTGAEWDVIEDEDYSPGVQSSSSRLYQIILPFNGAAWSSDALAQSLRRTLPKVCGNGGDEFNSSKNISFFGWSAMEWSNFLVGYKDGGGEKGIGDSHSMQHPTYNKLMWWTWTSLPSSIKISNNDQSLSFGIQYQTTIPAGVKDWLPDNFLNKKHECAIGERNAFEVLYESASGVFNNYQLVPITTNNEGEGGGVSEDTLDPIASKFFYTVGIEQVLRRHHTNQGRFESTINLKPHFDTDASNSVSCRLKYRQLLPNFLTPMWRSLRVTNDDINDNDATGDAFYSNSEQLQASVEWDLEKDISILTVEVVSGQSDAMPSSFSKSMSLPFHISISLEYSPSFLTIDDFPGDPNRGRVLPPGRVTVRCDPSTLSKGVGTTTAAYSNSLLLLPPVPDLSMPFNVISVTSSLYAYLIGAIITILVRKGSEKIKYKMYPDKKPKSKFKKLRERLREKVGGLKTKLFGKEDTKASQKDSDQESTTRNNADSLSSNTGENTVGKSS